MLKLGVYKSKQDTRLGRLWRRGLTSASLLADISGSEADPARFERIVEHVQLSNGVARTTSRGRFDNLDGKINDFLASIYAADTPLIIEELAGSTGYTGFEWFRSLQKRFPALSFVLSDRLLYLVEVSDTKSGAAFIVEPDGAPIQYVRPPFVVSLVTTQSRIFVVNRLLQKRGAREWAQLRHLVTLPENWHDPSLGTSVERKEAFSLRRIPLIHPQVLQAVGKNFRLKEHSIFDALDRPADVIRTMNILNRSYFSEAQLLEASRAVWKSLNPGGCWIVGRTVDETVKKHELTVYRKGVSGWEIGITVGSGSEIDHIVRPSSPDFAQSVGVGERGV